MEASGERTHVSFARLTPPCARFSDTRTMRLAPCGASRPTVRSDRYEAPTSCKALPLVSTPMVRTMMTATQKNTAMVMNIP